MSEPQVENLFMFKGHIEIYCPQQNLKFNVLINGFIEI